MPRLEEIEQLKEIVNSLGNEKEIRGKRGEEIEEIASPEGGLSSDLQNLLGITGEGEQAPQSEQESIPFDELKVDDISQAVPEETQGAPSFEEFMGAELPPETEVPQMPAGGEPQRTAAGLSETEGLSGEEPDFDLSSIPEFQMPETGETPGPGGMEDTPSEAPQEEAVFEGEAQIPETPQTPGAEEPTFDLSDFGIGEETPGQQGPAPIPETPEALLGTEEDLAQFDLPNIADFEAETKGAKPQAAPPDATGLEENLFDFDQEAGAGGAMESGHAPSEAPGEEIPASFEMPDLSSLDGGFEEVPSFVPEAGETPVQQVPSEQVPGGEAIDEGIDQFGTDEFALPDFGKEFGVPTEEAEKRVEGEKGPSSPTERIARKESLELGELSGVEAEYEYSQRDFESIKATLATLPLNLKIVVEELIGEKDLKGEKLKRLTDALIAGESPKVIASIVAAVSGQKVLLPKSFEKRTGLAYEKEKDTFAYFIKTKGLKAAIIAGVAFVVLFVLLIGAYQYIYKPLAAMPIYDEGYEAIKAGLFEKANAKFKEASEIWVSKDQFYRYGEAFTVIGSYPYAAKKYEELLTRFPHDTKGTIDYARLETLRKKFDHSEKLLVDDLLMREMYNFDGIVAAADNYLAWAEEDFSKMKDAQYYFDFLTEHYKDKMAAHLKRLDYFIRSERIAREKGNTDFDNTNIVLTYEEYLKRNKYNTVDPLIYTELAEYLIDKNELENVPEILEKTLTAQPVYPETFYEIARYSRLRDDMRLETLLPFYASILGRERVSKEMDIELLSLETAVALFEKPPTDKKDGRSFQFSSERNYSLQRNAKLILAYNRLGEFYVKQGKPELAEDKYLSAQKLYEADSANLSRTRFAADGNFGKIYYNLGALSFSIANYRRALDYFTTAEKNGFEDTDQTYKKGYVYYDRSDYDNALLEFHKANGQLPDSANILFALGTTEYRRFQYPVAEGYFLYLVEQLEKKKAVTGVTRIEDDVQYRALVTNLFIAYNNLGCTYYKRSAFGSDMNATKAVAYLQKATELYDSISRDPEAIERLKETTFTTSVGKKDSKSPAPFYNLDVIFHGKNMQTTLGEQGDLIIYDLAAASFANDSAGSGGTAASGQTELR